MNVFIKRAIVMSAFALTTNSWAYPIYPDFFERFGLQRAVDNKSGRDFVKKIHGSNTVITSHDFNENNSFADLGDSDSRSSADYSGSQSQHSSAGNHRHSLGGLHLGALFYADDGFNNRLFKEAKSWKIGKDNSNRWIGFNGFIFPSENGNGPKGSVGPSSSGGPHGNGPRSDGGHSEGAKNPVGNGNGKPSENNGVHATVSEPSSVALIFSGVLGLFVTRRLGKRKQKHEQC